MPLIALTPERIAREMACAAAGEHAARIERRRLVVLFVVMALSVAGEAGFLALAMRLMGDAALIAQSCMILCGLAPLFLIIFQQLGQKD